MLEIRILDLASHIQLSSLKRGDSENRRLPEIGFHVCEHSCLKFFRK